MSDKKQQLLWGSGETYLIFDTETTGLPLNNNWNAPVDDFDTWPRLVQIAWEFYRDGVKVDSNDFIIRPDGFEIPIDASDIHGITTERAEREGVTLQGALSEFQNVVSQADYLVGHNISFDEKVVGAEFLRMNMQNCLAYKNKICTKEASTNFCAIPNNSRFGSYKWPKLSELHIKLFGADFEDAHSAASDVSATAKCFWELKKRGIISK